MALKLEAAARARQRIESERKEAAKGYRAHGAIAKLFASSADELILSGPAGTGKTRGALEYLHQTMLANPGARALIGRKTRRSLTETALVTYERDVLGPDNPICGGPKREQRHVYRYPNGSEVVVGGLDKASKTLSAEYDLIYINEATELTLADWETLLRALRSGKVAHQRLIGDCNPDRADHWIVQRANAGQLELIKTVHEDNPLLWDGGWTARGASYISKLDKLTGVRRKRLRLGLWVNAEGAVYEAFDPAVHVIDRFEIPADWRRFRAIDFGYTNPFVCLWAAEDADGRMYVYRQIYQTKRLVSEHAARIKALSGDERYAVTVADHDAEDRATLHAAGIRTEAAQKAVTVGIEAVQKRLQIAGDGKPRLFVFRDALDELDEDLREAGKPIDLLSEIGGYQWQKAVDGKANKEAPVKVDDHAMDALRYLVMAVDGGARQQLAVANNIFYS